METKLKHVCTWYAYRDEVQILYFKEAMHGWNWNLVIKDSDGTERAFQIMSCPWCGRRLDERYYEHSFGFGTEVPHDPPSDD